MIKNEETKSRKKTLTLYMFKSNLYMFKSKTPIGAIINHIHKNPNSYAENILFQDIETVIDLIKIRIKKKGVSLALESLFNHLFELRLKIIQSDLILSFKEEFSQSIDNRIRSQFNHSTIEKKLELTFVNGLSIYKTVTSSILNKEPFNAIGNLTIKDYREINNLFDNLPGEESKFINHYLRSSIAIDYTFIVSDLILSNQLRINNDQIDTLRKLLKDSIEDFALYSYILNLWNPDDIEETQWIRNIKIRIGFIESLHSSNQYSTEELKKILVA